MDNWLIFIPVATTFLIALGLIIRRAIKEWNMPERPDSAGTTPKTERYRKHLDRWDRDHHVDTSWIFGP